MTATPTIPLSPADRLALAAVVRERWPEAARVHGVEPQLVTVEILADGALDFMGGMTCEAWRLALSHLAETLEDLGYAVAWEGGVRVTGWAAVRSADLGIPLASLDPWDPRRRAHEDDLARARAARRGPGPVEDEKRVGAVKRWRATYGKGGG